MTLVNRTCGIYALFTVSFILGLFGIITTLLWTTIFNRILARELEFTNGSRSFKMWEETPIPMYFNVYMYNWTNAQEVFDSKWNVEIKLDECGPYVFSEHHQRVNWKWDKDGTLITYQQKRIWHFLPEKSKGNLNDTITFLNPIISFVGYAVRNKSTAIKVIVNEILKEFENSLAIKKPVKQLLFDGYDDALLKIVNKLNTSGIHIPFDKFGWFYQRNGSETYDGTFTMHTGKNDLDMLGMMHLWNKLPYTNDFESYCSYVNGTSGELWPPIHDYDTISIFSPDTCSSLALNIDGTEGLHGITGKKYSGTDYMFDNGTKYPQQSCFKEPSEYLPSGVRNLSKCKFGAPIFMSFPHYYLADPSYRKNILGLEPNKDEHEMYISLEPTTGVPLNVRAALQLNLMIEPIKWMGIFKDVKKTYMPMFWFTQTATLPEDYAELIKPLLVLPQIALFTAWGLIGFACLFAAIAVYILKFTGKTPEEVQPLVVEKKE